MPAPTHVAYYISSHGYGHATRAIQLCHSFLRAYDGLRITVVSQASSQIFLPLLNSCERVDLRPAHIDSAVVQPTPYLLNVNHTISNLLHLDQDEIVARETDWLKTHAVDLVLVDAPYIPCIAASSAGVMSILITNFSFAEVFSYFDAEVESEDRPKLEAAVGAAVKGYSHADVWMRLPGWLPNPGFLPISLPSTTWVVDEQLEATTDGTIAPEYSLANPKFERKVIDTPLITRPATTTSRIDLLKILEIPTELHNSKLLLLLLPLPDPPPQVPSDWICVVAGSTPTMLLPDRYFVAPGDVHIPDVMKISSCVMAKLGYGTVSEVLGADVPLVYIPRRQFIEEYGLRNLVESWPGYEGRAERMEIQDFEKGYWWWVITELASREKTGKQEPGSVDDGDAIRRMVIEEWGHWNACN
ncbi:hypothetical protein ABW20_dc0104220 [Dactylellina cionopaga]|nr:hypothetical protein ABW20_dc0104220 [Dactylellina cionopaga]